jgi:hypothetical protein
MKKLWILLAIASLVNLGFVAATHADGFMTKSGVTTYDLKSLIGTEVKNPGGIKLGVITDFVSDSRGHILFAILYDRARLEYGGEHVQGKYVAVPFEALSITKSPTHRMTVLLDLEKGTMDYAPSYHRADLKKTVWDAGIYRFYGEQPYWNERAPLNPIR